MHALLRIITHVSMRSNEMRAFYDARDCALYRVIVPLEIKNF